MFKTHQNYVDPVFKYIKSKKMYKFYFLGYKIHKISLVQVTEEIAKKRIIIKTAKFINKIKKLKKINSFLSYFFYLKFKKFMIFVKYHNRIKNRINLKKYLKKYKRRQYLKTVKYKIRAILKKMLIKSPFNPFNKRQTELFLKIFKLNNIRMLRKMIRRRNRFLKLVSRKSLPLPIHHKLNPK